MPLQAHVCSGLCDADTHAFPTIVPEATRPARVRALFQYLYHDAFRAMHPAKPGSLQEWVSQGLVPWGLTGDAYLVYIGPHTWSADVLRQRMLEFWSLFPEDPGAAPS